MNLLTANDPDELEPLDVSTKDRAELIEYIHELERQRSAWELRVRACQERESLYLTFVNDMGSRLAETYQSLHDGVSEQARKAEALVEVIQGMVKRVEKL